MKADKIFITLFISVCASLFAVSAAAQETVPEGYVLVDSVVYRPAAAVDTTLAGKDIYSVLPSRERGDKAGVNVNQSREVASSMRAHVAANGERTLAGYRVRIFFDNRQTARVESEATLKRFESLYHDVAAYRTYANPYFKVTVGDFRTKSEAMALLNRIKADFPSAFVVKENIGYPVVDKENAYVVDTVKVLRPVAPALQ